MENTERVLFDNDAAQWYFAQGEKWFGPFSAADLYEKVQGRELSWAHYIWKPGFHDWKRLCDVAEFQGAAPPQPPRTPEKPTVKTATRASAPAPVRIWYLYYNDSQFGPFSAEEVEGSLSAGKINAKVHAWRNGMDGWERLESVADFRDFLMEKANRDNAANVERRAEPRYESQREQRSAPRKPLVAKIVMASESSVDVAVCRDISVGGMQVLTDRLPSEVGAHLKLNVSAQNSIEPFVAEGVVVRVLEDRRGFSFRFEKLSDRARSAIENYISGQNTHA